MVRRREARDCSIEEYEAWSAAYGREQALHHTANEVGGPRLSMVPKGKAMAPHEGPDDLENPADFNPTASRHRHGWTAYRQRLFAITLAETGSVHQAASECHMSVRSAYYLRIRSEPFRRAWDHALQLAVGRLSAIAFDRAINGRPEQIYQDGELVGERRVPNDRLLQWLLARLDPKRFAMPWEQRGDIGDPQGVAAAAFPALIDAIEDVLPFEPFPMTARVDGTTGETLGGEPGGDPDDPARDRENW